MRLSLGKTVVFLSTILSLALLTLLWKIGIVRVETVLRSGFGKGLWTREADV